MIQTERLLDATQLRHPTLTKSILQHTILPPQVLEPPLICKQGQQGHKKVVVCIPSFNTATDHKPLPGFYKQISPTPEHSKPRLWAEPYYFTQGWTIANKCNSLSCQICLTCNFSFDYYTMNKKTRVLVVKWGDWMSDDIQLVVYEVLTKSLV